MTVEEMIPLYEAMPDRNKVLFLARLAHELTVRARDTYEPGTERVADPVRLRHFNEFQHRVTSHQRDVIVGTADRYPDAVFLNIALEFAREANCEEMLRRLLDPLPEAQPIVVETRDKIHA